MSHTMSANSPVALEWLTLPEEKTLAQLALLLGALGFGLIPLFSRIAMDAGASAGTVVLARYGFAALLVVPWLCVPREHRWRALLAVVLGMLLAAGMRAYVAALAIMPVELPALIFYSYPAFVLVLAWLTLGQRPRVQGWIATALVLLAALLIAAPGPLKPAVGHAIWLTLLAPLAIALITTALAGPLAPLRTATKTFWLLFGTCLISVPAAIGGEGSTMPATTYGWLALAALAFVTGLIPQLLFGWATPRTGAAPAALAGAFELLVTLFVGWVVFLEQVTLAGVCGALLILVALVLARPPATPSVA